jgi:DNA-binding beta-propeller fold protein YncE
MRDISVTLGQNRRSGQRALFYASWLTIPFFVAPCGGLSDSAFPTGSATLAVSSDAGAIYTLNEDLGTISVVNLDTFSVQELEIGLEPSRIARIGDRVFVTLRGERGLAVLHESNDGLVLDEVLATGAEPIGLVASEDGNRLFIALSQENEVQELDPEDMSVRRTWEIPDEPRWLALHPDNKSLFVGSAYRGTLTWIDLYDNEMTELDLPTMLGTDPNTGQSRDLSARITGDMAITSDGDLLGIPVLYVDNLSPVGAPTPNSTPSLTSGYGAGATTDSVSRFNPSIVTIPLNPGGKPDEDLIEASLVVGEADVPGDNFGENVRSYLRSVTFSPDGSVMFATMESSRVVAAISTRAVRRGIDGEDFPDVPADRGVFTPVTASFIVTDQGPRGVVFTDDTTAYVHAFLDRTLGDLNVQVAMNELADLDDIGRVDTSTYQVSDGVALTQNRLDGDLEFGRRLFYTAVDSRMSHPGAGVSCSTCHLDARTDGLTWTFVEGVRQTPSLAGDISQTAPVTWIDGVDSVGDEAMATSQDLMGGDDLYPEDAERIEAFVNSTRPVDISVAGISAAAITRGAEIFYRSEVGCAECHYGENGTDNKSHELYGFDAVNTPALTGIAATAPYLHDGSMRTLTALVDKLRDGSMGSTESLSDDERADLVAYLSSL